MAETDVRLGHAEAALAELQQMHLPIEAAERVVTLLRETLSDMMEYRTLLQETIRQAKAATRNRNDT